MLSKFHAKIKQALLSINNLVILSFIFFAIFNVLLVWHSNIYSNGDLYFHLSRFLELARSNFAPRFAFHTISDNGSAVMTMYPYLFIYPFALLLKFIGINYAVFIIYLLFIINALTMLLISYYSSIKLGNKLLSYIFALIYTLSYEFITLNFRQCDFGMSLSATFMPLVIFGFIYWLKNNDWLMLSIGVSCIIYSNISIAFFTPILLIFWLICNYKLIHTKRIISLCKAIILTLFTTAWFWIPAIKMSLLNKFTGVGNVNGSASSINLISAIRATLYPNSAFLFNGGFSLELTIYAFIGIIIGAIYFKDLNKYLRQAYIFAIAIMIICTNILPWNSPLFSLFGGLLQTTIRLYLIPQVIFEYIFAYGIYNIFFTKASSSKKVLSRLFLIIIMLLLVQTSYGAEFQSQQHAFRHSNFSYETFTNVIGSNSIDHDYYLGNNDRAIVQDQGFINNNNTQKIQFNAHANGTLTFNNNTNNTISKLSLPVLYYHGQPYRCYLNHKLIKSYPNQNRLMTINNVSTGKHRIHVITPLTKTDIFARLLTIISMFIYLDIIYRYQKQ